MQFGESSRLATPNQMTIWFLINGGFLRMNRGKIDFNVFYLTQWDEEKLTLSNDYKVYLILYSD